ncbi:MAG TPA: chemotaxis protein CheA [Steroidobacteraceae bacterium]|nr:chemotaxis protein CheA [Steroidobacteraceae bacterium]
MGIDLAQFHEAFFEESFEALESMEASLLKLDVAAPDAETINTIFRVAHSIKGGAGMFNFADIASFTHTLETLLDGVRAGRTRLSTAIMDLLLKSVDVMREMLRAAQRKESFDPQRVADLQFDLEVAVANNAAAAAPTVTAAPAATAAPAVTAVPAVAATPAPAAPAPAAAPQPPAAPAAEAATEWLISVRPLQNMLSRGNEPLALFAALAEHGELSVTADVRALPALEAIEAHRCYLTWQVRLTGAVTRERIAEAFEWVEGDCDYRIEAAAASAATPAVPEAAAPEAAHPTPDLVAEPAPAPAAAAAPAGETPAAARAARTEAAPAASGGDAASIRVSTQKIDELINTVGEVVITQSMLAQLGAHAEGPTAERLRSGLAQLERNVRELHESVMRVRMLPIGFAFSRFPRLVRDVAQRLGKQIDLKLTGEQTELDKTVLERIGDPLVHLVRNSIDHGIEKPEARVAAGKPAAGTVHLEAFHRGSAIIIEVSDDGQGLDSERILAKARARGLIAANEIPSQEAIHELIFLPGFSTAEQTTDLSGRGVGMDVVRRNIKSLGGKIDIRSERGKGSRFSISLPLTLAIVDGQSVSVGDETYIVPLVSIVESLQIRESGVNRLSTAGEVISFRGAYLPLVRLHDLFGIEPRSRAIQDGLVVVVEGDGQRVGLFVDDLRGQQQVVIKSLESNYGHVQGVSGATILGDGSVALILDVPGLIRSTSSRREAA